MKIVSLYGTGASGKTTTLKLFLKKALSTYRVKVTVTDTSLYGSTIDEYIADIDSSAERDCYVVMDIDGHCIGITTVGDNRWCLENDFKHFDNCELCFCAARSNGETHKFLRNKCNGDNFIQYKQTRIDSYPPNGIETRWQYANESMAELLMKELQSFLNGTPYKF
ncbi:MAG: hypothetical protein NC131_18195 [Roseburia sp.]|nr:hypothetical protein [Roseburia sp.]